jgi:hypothetical protein
MGLRLDYEAIIGFEAADLVLSIQVTNIAVVALKFVAYLSDDNHSSLNS